MVGSNASQSSVNWGSWDTKAVAERFGTQVYRPDGVARGGLDGRGDGHGKHTAMPALLLEPMFVSNPQQADILRRAGRRHIALDLLVQQRRREP